MFCRCEFYWGASSITLGRQHKKASYSKLSQFSILATQEEAHCFISKNSAMYPSMPISFEDIRVTSSINWRRKWIISSCCFTLRLKTNVSPLIKPGPHLRGKHIRKSIRRLCANRDINISPRICSYAYIQRGHD